MSGAKEFVAASLASCLAEIITLPFDTVKVRIQVDETKATTYEVISDMLNKEGLSCFFQGLEPALLRQTFYGGLRFLMYYQFQMILEEACPNMPVVWKKMMCAFLAGLLASGLCNPLDLVKLRMQTMHRSKESQTKMPPPQEKLTLKSTKKTPPQTPTAPTAYYYSGTLDAFIKIYKTEGLVGLYQGVFPTMGRASMLASCEMSYYDIIKSWLLEKFGPKYSLVIHVISGLLTSFIASVASNPFDMVKSRLMSQQKNSRVHYTGVVNCFVVSVRNEGLSVLWSGFIAYFMRLGPNTVFTFVFLEQTRYLVQMFVGWWTTCRVNGII